MNITILGTGRFATDFAPSLVHAGHLVTFGSRTPGATGLVGPVLTHSEAAAGAGLVVNALPGKTAIELLPTLVDQLAGKVLLDASNAFEDDGTLTYPNSSVGEQLQALLPNTRVVKTLNYMAGYVAADPASIGKPSTLFLSGDDSDAKNLVSGVLAGLGWVEETRIDLGDITTARATEHLGYMFWALVRKYGTGEFNYQLVLAPGVKEAAPTT